MVTKFRMRDFYSSSPPRKNRPYPNRMSLKYTCCHFRKLSLYLAFIAASRRRMTKMRNWIRTMRGSWWTKDEMKINFSLEIVGNECTDVRTGRWLCIRKNYYQCEQKWIEYLGVYFSVLDQVNSEWARSYVLQIVLFELGSLLSLLCFVHLLNDHYYSNSDSVSFCNFGLHMWQKLHLTLLKFRLLRWLPLQLKWCNFVCAH